MPRLTLAAVLTCSLLLHTAATAQPTLYLMVGGTSCQVGFPCPPPPARIVEVDLTAGRIVREIPFPAASVGVGNLSVTPALWEPILNETGDQVFSVGPTVIPFTGTFTVRRLDVATGAELARSTYVGNRAQVFLDRRTGRLFVVDRDAILAFDPVTLALLGRIALPTGEWTFALVFEPNRPRAYFLHQPFRPFQPFEDYSYLNVFDTERLVPLAEVRIPYAQATWRLAVAPEPPAPVNLSATVAASQVTLTWQSGPRSPAITHFEIEAGSEPGAANLARLRSDDASFTLVVADVPPGRYYVRVRAYNYGGTSEPSNEFLVTVP